MLGIYAVGFQLVSDGFDIQTKAARRFRFVVCCAPQGLENQLTFGIRQPSRLLQARSCRNRIAAGAEM